MAKSPGFSAVAVITLALAIAANSAVFSVVNAVVLRPYSYHEPESLVVVWETQLQRGLPYMFASPPNFADWRELNHMFDDMAAFDSRDFFLRQDADSARIRGSRVTSNLFSLLNVPPLLGRQFIENEDQPGKEPVAMLSHRIWRDRFGGDPAIVGNQIVLSDQNYTVIGVMPDTFSFPPPINLEGRAPDERTDIWIPFGIDFKAGQRAAHFMTVIGRMKKGVTIERAQQEMTDIASALEQDHPSTNAGWSVSLAPLTEQVLGEVRPALLALLGAVGFVLLIACVNVANLLLARGTARQKEFAIRLALGAGRGGLIRQLLTESLMLALAGCLAGLVLAQLALEALLKLAPANVPRLDETSIDGVVIAFTVGASLLTGLLFGVAPIFQSFSVDINGWLKEGGRAAGHGARAFRTQSGLVVLQVALSLIILVSAGLLLKSFRQLAGVDTGFRPDKVLTLRITLPQTGYSEAKPRIEAFREIERSVSSLTGIDSAGLVNEIPLAYDRQGTVVFVEGKPRPAPGEEQSVNFTFATPGYFRSIGIRLERGRDFTDQDGQEGNPVVIVNSALARALFASEDPIGRHIFPGFNTQEGREIVGIVGDERHSSLRDDPAPQVYVPYFQVPWSRSMSLVVKTRAQPASVLSAVRDQLRAVVPAVPVYDVKEMEQVVSESLAQPRFSAVVISIFSVAALILASVGIYGFMSFLVGQSRQEIGIRMALGANRTDILRLVLGRAATLTAAGLVIGVAGGLVVTRLLSNLLFGVTPTDSTTFFGISVLLATVVMASCYIPARRATRVDPIVVLRCE